MTHIAPLCTEQVNTLFVLMGEKKEDDEFVLQIAFAFNKFLTYDDTRLALLNYTQVRQRLFCRFLLLSTPRIEPQGPSICRPVALPCPPSLSPPFLPPSAHLQVVFYLIDLLQDKNKEVQKVADQCLDIIMDTDEEWAVRIRNLKFESFNQEWLEVVQAPPDQVMVGCCVGKMCGGPFGDAFPSRCDAPSCFRRQRGVIPEVEASTAEILARWTTGTEGSTRSAGSGSWPTLTTSSGAPVPGNSGLPDKVRRGMRKRTP